MSEGRIDHADVVVVGAGVLGCAIAAELSRYDASVVVLERRHDVGDETSKSNTGIVNPGWGGPPEELETQLCRRANGVWEDLCQRLDVPFRRCGMVALALSDADREAIPALVGQTREAGLDAHELGPDALRERAPHANPDALGAVAVPEMAIVDSPRLAVAYAELAALNGVRFHFDEPVVAAERAGDHVASVRTPQRTVRARFVVNCAGLFADAVSELLGCERFWVRPRRGEWLVADREAGRDAPCILAGIPTPRTAGVMVTPTTHGSLLLGPSAEDDEDKLDRSTHNDVVERVFARCRALSPGLDRGHVVKHFSGLRPHSERLYRIERSAEAANVVHACGVRSTGVSASPAIADRVRDLLAEAGLRLVPRPGAVDRLPPRLRLADGYDCAALADDPLGRTVVCACEKVTARELHDAFRSPLPPRSLTGLARRTHATWGRCQGSACLSGVSFIASLYLPGPAWSLPIGEGDATLGVAEARRV